MVAGLSEHDEDEQVANFGTPFPGPKMSAEPVPRLKAKASKRTDNAAIVSVFAPNYFPVQF